MSLPAGMAAAAVAKAGEHVLKGAQGRQERKTAREELQRNREMARLALIQQMGGQTGDELTSTQLAIAEIDKLVHTEARQKTRRTAIRTGAVVLTAGAVVAGGLAGLKSCENTATALAPKVTVTTEQRVDAALQQVRQRDDIILLTGSGKGQADISTRARLSAFGIGVTLPSQLLGNEAHVVIPRSEDVISKQGARTLQGYQDPQTGKWGVLVKIDPHGIATQVTGNQPPDAGSGSSVGFLDELAHLGGINKGEQTRAYQTAETIAVDQFSALAAHEMTDDPHTVAAAEANSVRGEITQVAQAVPAGETRDLLGQLAAGKMWVEYVDSTSDKNHPAFVAPDDVSSHLLLPKLPASRKVDVPVAEFSMSAPDQLLMSEQTTNALTAIRATPNYELLMQPLYVNGVDGSPGATPSLSTGPSAN